MRCIPLLLVIAQFVVGLFILHTIVPLWSGEDKIIVCPLVTLVHENYIFLHSQMSSETWSVYH